MKYQLILFFLIGNASAQQLSPYGTGFQLGTKEDLEIRLAWAKKDPCFKHGFNPSSKEYLELKKHQAITYGPNPPKFNCSKK